MNPSFFLSPGKPGKVIWGVGPAFVIPTATSTLLGQGKLSLGLSFVALAQPGPWTIGALVNNVFSVAGWTHRPYVNQMLFQYFVNYNMKNGWYVSVSPILTANWRGSSGRVWTVPFGGGVGRIMKLGFQPVNLTAQFYGNAVYPTGNFLVERTGANRIPVSQVNQRAADGTHEKETARNGTAATEEIATPERPEYRTVLLSLSWHDALRKVDDPLSSGRCFEVESRKLPQRSAAGRHGHIGSLS